MKKILLSLAATAALACAAAPAAAQSWNNYDRPSYGRLDTSYVDGLDWRIREAAQQRRISWGEARQLREILHDIKPLAWRVQNGEARGYERQRLAQGVRTIETAIYRNGYRGERRYDDRRYDDRRYDDRRYDDRYDDDGRGWRR